MTTLHSTDADPAPTHLTAPRPPSPDDPHPPARWGSPSPDDPHPPEVADSSTVGVGALLTGDSHLRIDGELAGRLLRSSRWQQ
jgi:hypothetical protein